MDTQTNEYFIKFAELYDKNIALLMDLRMLNNDIDSKIEEIISNNFELLPLVVKALLEERKKKD